MKKGGLSLKTTKHIIYLFIIVLSIMTGCTNTTYDISHYTSDYEGRYNIIFASMDDSTYQEPFHTEQIELFKKHKNIIDQVTIFHNVKKENKFGLKDNLTIIVLNTKQEIYRCNTLAELDTFLTSHQ